MAADSGISFDERYAGREDFARRRGAASQDDDRISPLQNPGNKAATDQATPTCYENAHELRTPFHNKGIKMTTSSR